MKRLRDWRVWLAGLGVAIVAVWGAAEWALRSDWFEHRLRQEVQARLEKVLGGEVSIGGLLFDRSSLSIELRDVTARTTAGSEPYLTLPQAKVGLRIDSFWRGEASLASILVERPELRIDSSELDIAEMLTRGRRDVDTLALGVGTLEVRDATVRWNDAARHLSLLAEDVDLTARPELLGGCVNVDLSAASSAASSGQTRLNVDSAQAKAGLCSDHIAIEQATFGVNGATAQISGEIRNPDDPTAALAVKASGPLEAFQPYLPETAAPRGTFAFDGKLDWRPAESQLELQGDLSAAELRLSRFEKDAPPGTLHARLSGNQDRLRLDDIRADLFGGRFQGSATVDNPLVSPGGSLQGDVEGFRLRSLLESLAGQGGPDLRAAPWTASVRAHIDAAKPAGQDLTAKVEVTLEGAGERGLSGDVRARYDASNRLLTIDSLDVRTGAGATLLSHGTWSGRGADLRLDWSSEDDEDLIPALSLLGIQLDKLPVELLGHASLEGDLKGRIAPANQRDFVFAGRIATSAIRLLNYEWTSLDTEIEFRQDLLRIANAQLRDGDGRAEATFEAELEPGVPLERKPLLGWVRARNLPAEKALAAGRLPAMLSGLTDADAAISGSAVNPDLRASATIRNGQLAGRRFDMLQLEVDTTGELARVSKVALTRGNGRLTGSGTYDRASGALDVKVRGSDWGVDQLVEAMNGDWPASGVANLDLHVQAIVRPGQRPVEQLRADGQWSVASFDWGGHPFGDLGGSISTDSDTVTVDWKGAPLGGTLGGKASLRLDQNELSGSAEFTGFDAAQVLRLAGASSESLSGSLSGGFTFHADPARLADVEIEGSIEKAELDISELPGAGQGYALYNPFPMRWAIRKQTLELEHMRLQGKGADFEVDGDVALSGSGSIDAKAEGMLDLAVLQSFRQDLQAEGATVLDVSIGGTLDSPSIDGKLRIENGSVRSSEIPNGLNALNGEVTFAGRDVRIEELSALSGGGKLVFSGTASFADKDPEYRFNVDVDRVRLRYPANISSLIDGQIVLSGASNHGLLAGEVIVRRASTNSQISLGALLAALREPTQTPARAPWLDQLQLNVHVASGPDFELETTLVRNIEADLDLRLVGTAVSPSVLGRMNINQGQVNFNGSRYTINRGEISFVNPFRVEPVLDFELQTRIRAIDIGLILSGPARRLNMSYRSDPPLSISDLVNLVAVGRSPTTDPVLASQQRVQQQSLFQTGANNVFEQAIERPVSPGLQRFFGVSRLKVDPQAGGAEANPSARISTEQQITNEVTLIYTYDLSSAQQQTFRLEYAPDRRWTIVLTRDQNGLVGSDVLYKTRLP